MKNLKVVEELEAISFIINSGLNLNCKVLKTANSKKNFFFKFIKFKIYLQIK